MNTLPSDGYGDWDKILKSVGKENEIEIEIINEDEMENSIPIEIKPIVIPIVNCLNWNSNLRPLPHYVLLLYHLSALS